MNLVAFGVILAVLGAFAEIVGGLYVLEDLTGRGPTSISRTFWRKTHGVRKWLVWKPLRLVGYRGLYPVTKSFELQWAIAGPQLLEVPPNFFSGSDRSRLRNLEQAAMALHSRLWAQEKLVAETRLELNNLVNSVAGTAKDIFEHRLKEHERRQFPLRAKSLLWVIGGVFLNAVGTVSTGLG